MTVFRLQCSSFDAHSSVLPEPIRELQASMSGAYLIPSGEPMMLISETLNAAINKQIGNELGNANQYLVIAAYFEGDCLFGLAKIFDKQAEEERDHARRFVKFVLDAGGKVAVPAIPAPQNEFKSAEDAAQVAYDSEVRTTEQIYALMTLATAEKNYIAIECSPVVRQRAARRGVERPDPPGGDQACRAERLMVEAYLSHDEAK